MSERTTKDLTIQHSQREERLDSQRPILCRGAMPLEVNMRIKLEDSRKRMSLVFILEAELIDNSLHKCLKK